MEQIRWNYTSERAASARFGTLVRRANPKLILWTSVAFVILSIGLLVIGSSLAWFMASIAAIPFIIYQWFTHHLYHLPTAKKVEGIDSIMSGDVLGQLPENPSPKDVAKAVGNVVSGQFIGARFGVTTSMLQQLVSENPRDTLDLWQVALDVKNEAGIEHVTGSVLAVALLRSYSEYQSLLAQIHLEDADMIAGVRWQQHLRELIDHHRQPRRTGGIARDWSFGYIPLLARFAQNISDSVAGGILRVEIPSHEEALGQLIETFSAGGRQNAVLVGETGAGKTTVIHAFAERLLDASTNIPENLKFRQVLILDPSALLAAAPGRGQLEDLVMGVLGEAYGAKNVIICLDNAQLFFEEGVGSVDLTNVLQPILDAGKLRIILCMDEQRYLQISSRNPSLANSFNRIIIPPANQEETMRVMQDQLLITEFQRRVTYMYQALRETYRLSERYVHDLAMPGRAIKLLESAASFAEGGLVTVNSVQQAIEKTMNVKVSVASETADRETLLHMEDLIHLRMINQSRAVTVISDALRRARAGVRNEKRPIGTFLFLGPTGVGKTELAKALADVYFGGEGHIIRLDMNEYVRPDDVVRLISDGANESASLTAQVMKQPFSVILLDEIEKAHPQVLTTLLQMLDEGILRDIKNREISFRDAIIIATSNAGAERIREYIERGYQMEQFEQQFTNELITSGQFRPEFLNRFDEMVIFRPLDKSELLQVVDLMLAGVNATLENQKVSVIVDDDAKQYLVEKGYDPHLGARPMRRVIQRAVENTVAKQMLAGVVSAGQQVHISLDDVRSILDTQAQAQAIASNTQQNGVV